jgi:hypothetical protein
MKKTLVLLSVIVLISVIGCKKDSSSSSSSTGFNNQDLIYAIFTAGMSWNTHTKTVQSIVPINISVDNTVAGPKGGNIHVFGSITGSMNIDDKTSAVLGGTMLLGLTETINAYSLISNGQTYTANGAPHVSLTGTFTLLPGGTTFGTASSMQIGGGIRVTGPGYDQTGNINITININSNGTGGDVTGTFGGETLNYKF